MSNSSDDLTFNFGPGGSYSLHIPIKTIETAENIGQEFINAGSMLIWYARELAEEAGKKDTQLTFKWAREAG